MRTDPLTGLGNRGRMQVDLERTLRAGDRRASRRCSSSSTSTASSATTTPSATRRATICSPGSGARLRDAVGEDGIAYRVGGDEFCLLLTCDARSASRPSARSAAKALTASDKGVEVAASWGAAEIPGEADDPSAALQLADVRMYAQKESRRGAAHRDADRACPEPAAERGQAESAA